MGEIPYPVVVNAQPAFDQFGHQATQDERGLRHPGALQSASSPLILCGTCPPILPGQALPDARSHCDHFTTLEGATRIASATARTVSTASSRAITRSRMSI